MALIQQVLAKSMIWTKISNGIIQHYYNILWLSMIVHMYLFTWFIVHFSFVKNIVILCIFVFKSLISKMCRFMELCRIFNDVTIEFSLLFLAPSVLSEETQYFVYVSDVKCILWRVIYLERLNLFWFVLATEGVHIMTLIVFLCRNHVRL